MQSLPYLLKRFLIARVSAFLDRRGYTIARRRFHEENAIDLLALLADPIQKRKGRFCAVQIGANDGIARDPIRHLVTSRGWDLLAVEPMPAPFERLVVNYRSFANVRCAQFAIGTADGEATLYSLSPRRGQTIDDQYTSFSLQTLRQHWRSIPDLKDRIVSQKVPTLTLKTALQKYSIPDVDLLQIDTEGFDYEIIKMAFESGIIPTILAFEWVNLSKKDMWSCRCNLIDRGYQWLLVKGDVVAYREGPETGKSSLTDLALPTMGQ